LTSVPAVVAPVPQQVTAPVVAAPRTTPVGSIRPAVGVAPLRTSPSAVLALTGLIALLLVAVGRSVGNPAPAMLYARVERRRLDRVHRPEVVAALVPDLPRQEQSRQGRRPMSSAASTVT
jgi:hypothetical protein